MGLFSKSPAEKKLKELTGGFLLSSEFIKRLKEKGLEVSDGESIKNQLKQEIKNEIVTADSLETRLDYLINEKVKFNSKTSVKPVTFMECPNCHKKILKESIYCSRCHLEFDGKGNIRSNETKTCPICKNEINISLCNCPNCQYDFENKKSTDTINCPYCYKEIPKKTDKCPHCNMELNKTFKNPDKTQISSKSDLKTTEDENRYPIYTTDLIDNTSSTITFSNPTDYERMVSFLYNQKHNIKICPKCNTKYLIQDKYCYNCGFSLKEEFKKEKPTETTNDELSNLEKLYSKNVKNKYSTNFKYAYVKYLDAFSKNASTKTIDRIAKLYDTTPAKLNRQAKDDNYIIIAPPINGAYDLKVTDLKEILKDNNLKVSGRKEELIKRIGENIDEKELKRLFPKKTYIIAEDAFKFLDENNYILFLNDNKAIEHCFYPSEIESEFDLRHYSDDELYDTFEKLISSKLDYVLRDEIWIDYKTYLNGLIRIYELKKDYNQALKYYFKIFLYDLNNFSPNLNKACPRNTNLTSKLIDPLTELIHKENLPIDDLKKIFGDVYNTTPHEMVISFNDALVYLLKLFNGEDLAVLNNEINKIYSNPY